jgi:hypothetical protein
MPKFGNYFVVEFRLPIQIDTVNTVEEALSIAGQICKDQHGFKPDNWYARIFEYTTGSSEIGHVREHFYNPHSATHREITKNVEYFNELVHKGLTLDDKKNKSKIIKTLLEEN